MLAVKIAGGSEERYYFFENSFSAQWSKSPPATFLPIVYNHDQIIEHPSEPVFYVETEPEADKLTALGLVATTYGAPGAIPPYLRDRFHGRVVLAVGQAGEIGQTHVHAVAREFSGAATVRAFVVHSPSVGTPANYHLDDWLSDTADQDQRNWLLALANGEVFPGTKPSSEDEVRSEAEFSSEAVEVQAAVGSLTKSPTLADCSAPEQASNPRRIVLSNDEQAISEPEWLVQGVLPSRGTGMLYAPSSVGKTFVGIDLCHAVRNGVPWGGRTVKQGNVIYVAAEDSAGVWYRARSQFVAAGLEKPFSIIRADQDGLSLAGNSDGLDKLIGDIETTLDQGDVRLVFIETFEMIAEGIDENMSGPVGQIWSKLAMISRRFGCFVLLAHHTGKDADNYRGSSTFKNRADTVLSIKQLSGDKRRLLVEKQRNGPSGISAEFFLDQIPGTQTCKVAFSRQWGAGKTEHHEDKKPKDGKAQQTKSAILGILQEKYCEEGKGYITKAELRQHPDILSYFLGRTNDAARKGLDRALEDLEHDGLIKKMGSAISMADIVSIGPDMSKSCPPNLGDYNSCRNQHLTKGQGQGGL